MKNWLIASALVSLVSCTRNPTLLVTVSNVPATTRSLQVEAAHAGFPNVVDIEPYELPDPAPAASTFLLRMPANFNGDIVVSVGAFNQAGGKGCLVGTGSNSQTEFVGPDAQLTVSLDPAMDTACTGKKPVLLSATPGFGKTSGGEAVKLTGWGFKPDGAVTMGTKSAMFKFTSSSQVEVTTPARAGFGLTAIRFANKDGSFDLRKDLFRFFSDQLSFTTIPLQNTVAFTDTSGFAVGVFDPATTIDLAIALPGNPGRARFEFTTGGTILSGRRQDVTVGNNPGPIVTGDFDKDGDLDIVIANIDDGTVQLLKNDGAGIFTAGPATSVGGPGSFPVAMAAGDLNLDGAPDLAVVNKLPAPADGRLRVLLNQGDGTFMPIANNIDVGVEPVSVAIGLIGKVGTGNDELPDLLIANQASDNVNAFINQGVAGGLFQDSSGGGKYTLGVCAKPTSVKVFDTDGNGNDDLIIACTNENTIRIVKFNPFPNPSQFDLTTESMPRNMQLTDVNGDGFADLIVPAQGANKLNIFLNKTGTGFEGATYTSHSTSCAMPYQTQILDVDGDGKADLGVAGLGTAGVGCLSIMFNQAM